MRPQTKLYEKALPFLPHDDLLKMLLGYNYLFSRAKKRRGRTLKRDQEYHIRRGRLSLRASPRIISTARSMQKELKRCFCQSMKLGVHPRKTERNTRDLKALPVIIVRALCILRRPICSSAAAMRQRSPRALP